MNTTVKNRLHTAELAMLLAPKEEALSRRRNMIRRAGKRIHPYAGALNWCVEQGILNAGCAADAPVTRLPEAFFAPTKDFRRRSVYAAYREESQSL